MNEDESKEGNLDTSAQTSERRAKTKLTLQIIKMLTTHHIQYNTTTSSVIYIY